MVSQISLDCELYIGPENLGNKDGESGVPSSSHEHAAPQIPVKKQTRQWAAWTRQEEESFFAALRQVGKNFEKITCRVQSKNKDQVRHYYYRLVRRMNKLLGPELCLDAKNSKDTNAAMLRWWSLLEKYSCKASKLHLKPRRFKIFVEALENQLLKDRKKNTKKRHSTGENNASLPDISTSNQVRPSVHDNRAEKMVLVDRQNIEKVGTGKGALFKRHVNAGTNCKVDPASVKTTKSRRKTGLASTAAYKRWEKAAIAGVSLVADAAEHLERVNTNKENIRESPGHDGPQLAGEVTHSLPISPQRMLSENNKSAKLKLQLFPIDEWTRRALEMAHHNPHLELTLSTRKKISSVLEHLNRKWGNSSSLSGELILFPYWAQRENLQGFQKWTKDSPLCAADVYYQIGSPPTFRLRYGWFSQYEIESATAQALPCTASEHNLNSNMMTKQNSGIENQGGSQVNEFVTAEPVITAGPPSTSTAVKVVEGEGASPNINASTYHGSDELVSSLGEEIGDLAITRQVENLKGPVLSAGEWADSLTNISIGDLLSESTPNMDVNCTEFPVPLGSSCLDQIPFSCDSFDAAIAAHIYKHQNKADLQQGPEPHVSSIWDAEETCDAFAFQKTQKQKATMSHSGEDDKLTSLTGPKASDNEAEELLESENLATSSSTPVNLMDECRPDLPSENSNKDLGGLSDVYWPDSLGPLDLDIPSCRYHSNELILSDSLGGLSRLVANSLDAFQSCSLFGLDKKEPVLTGEPRPPATFSDLTSEAKFRVS